MIGTLFLRYRCPGATVIVYKIDDEIDKTI